MYKKFVTAIVIATTIVAVIFFLSVMTKAPAAGAFLLTAGTIAFFRKLWFGLMALFAFAVAYDSLIRKQ